MSSANPAHVAATTETDFQSFSAVVLKPLLQFICTECLASLPSSALDIADFVIQLLTANKELVNQMCRGSKLLEGSKYEKLETAIDQVVQHLFIEMQSRSDLQVSSASMSKLQPSTDLRLPACPVQISEEAILTFPTNLPPLVLARTLPAVAESYALLVRTFSESSSHAQSLMRAMNRAWKLAQDIDQSTSSPNSVSELPPSAVTPGGSAVRSSGAPASDLSLFHKLADAAAASLKRKDERFMGEVFGRHAKPLGLSAKALVSALHAIDPSAFSDRVSDANAAKTLKEVDMSNKGHADVEEFFRAAGMPILTQWKCVIEGAVAYRNSPSMNDRLLGVSGPQYGDIVTASDGSEEHENWLKVDVMGHGTKYLPIMNGEVLFFESIPQVPARVLLESCTGDSLLEIPHLTASDTFSDPDAETSPAIHVFLRFADVKCLSTEALMDALKEVDAPVLLSNCSPQQIFRRADADMSGSVDFAE
jgi:hypothetical protein